MAYQRGGLRQHLRPLRATPFVTLGAVVTLVAGAAIAVTLSMTAALLILVLVANFLIWAYLQGPANSVTVRGDTLRINNMTRRYLIPRSSVLAIDPFDSVGIRVKIKGGRLIWIDAFSRGTNLWLRPSGQALEVQAKELSEALFDTSAPDNYREPETVYRWPNIIAILFCLICVGAAVVYRFVL
jgi:hypothetical protein